MSNEELPENQYLEENTAFKEILAKYFNGEIPTDKARKSAFKLLFDTTLFNKGEVIDDTDEFAGMTPEEKREWIAYNNY